VAAPPGSEPSGDAWTPAVAALPPNGARFLLVDVSARAADAHLIKKLVLLKFCADTCDVKTKMVYVATYNSLKTAFTGVGLFLTASDVCEVPSYADLLKQLTG
jgi:hypothetical protein